jgi:hypothetical protein
MNFYNDSVIISFTQVTDNLLSGKNRSNTKKQELFLECRLFLLTFLYIPNSMFLHMGYLLAFFLFAIFLVRSRNTGLRAKSTSSCAVCLTSFEPINRIF